LTMAMANFISITHVGRHLDQTIEQTLQRLDPAKKS
jgi:hypothetical protein